MNIRDQLLTILSGHSPEYIPWIPRLKIWYEAHRRTASLPQKYRGWSLREIEQDLGMGTPARDGRIFREQLYNVEIKTSVRGNEKSIEYITPVGTVSTLYKRSKELKHLGIIGQDVQHLIKRPEDYPVVEYIIEHTKIIPLYEDFIIYDKNIGEAGLPIVSIGQDPMSNILQDLIGYNQAYYHLHDYPELVSHLLDALEEKAAKIQKVVLDSPATLILYGEHFDSQMTPPNLFRQYMLPHFQLFAEQLHRHGKYMVCHADADSSRLLDLIKEAGFDMVECFVTSPMVPVTLEMARATWDREVIIWGGIPSIMLCEAVSDDDFKEFLLDLFHVIAPGDAFILGVADNVMPETKFDRLLQISEMVRAFGKYPIQNVSLG